MPRPVARLEDIARIEAAAPGDGGRPFHTTWALLERSAALFADRTALKSLEPEDGAVRSLTYRELFAGVRGAMETFLGAGLGRGETVAILLPNRIETHLALWGAEAVGRACLINPMLAPAHIAAILRSVNARLIVTDSDVGAMLENSCQTQGDGWALPRILRVDPNPRIDGASAFSTETLVAMGSSEGSTAQPDDIASYLHTGGTTGAPKVAARTHRNEASQGWVVSGVMGLCETDILLCGLPMFHTNAVTVTGLAPFSRGACVLLAGERGYRNPALIERFWDIAREHGVTHFAGVPTIYSRLLETFDRPAPSLKFGICGAAPLSVELFRAFEDRTGVRILEGYGLTEAGCVSTLNPLEGERRIGSIGLRLPYQDLRTVRTDAQGDIEDTAPGEPGVLAVRGDNVFAGYVDARHNEGVFAPGGWLLTGDIARIDDQGYVWLTGRAKDLIIRGGHNIDPAVGEAALYSHPEVALAAVVGRPHADLGEVPQGYVTLKPGAAIGGAALVQHARMVSAEKAAAPAAVEVLTEMPVTAVGKIFKPALRLRALQSALDEALGDSAVTAQADLDAQGRLSCRLDGPEAQMETARRTISRLAPQLRITVPPHGTGPAQASAGPTAPAPDDRAADTGAYRP